MNKFIDINKADGSYRLEGCFDKFTIPLQWKALNASLKETPPKLIDLSAIIECDSALIALLVEIKRQYPEVSVVNIPENLSLLLDLYQVKALLS